MEGGRPVKIKPLPMPFQEAIEYWKDKVTLTPKQFYQLIEEYRTLAFTISGISALDVLNDIYAEINKVLETGITAQEFSKNVNGLLERKGWSGLTPYRMDVVFRTNVQTAFMVGHYRRMTDPDVVEKRPYWIYDAVNDSRTRPTHLAMDGKVFRYDHPFWDTWYPPNGFRCRCGVRTLSEAEVRARGITVDQDIPLVVEPPGQLARPLVPDRGFNNNPGKVRREPDISKYPEPLRKAYAKRADNRN